MFGVPHVFDEGEFARLKERVKQLLKANVGRSEKASAAFILHVGGIASVRRR